MSWEFNILLLFSLVENLKKGDNVVTSGGIYGCVTKTFDDAVNLEISKNVRIKVRRDCISTVESVEVEQEETTEKASS